MPEIIKLREPTNDERKNGLPKSKQEALDLGLTRFIPKDGKERIIRQYGSAKFPNGSIEYASTRKANRGSKGRRSEAEKIATPDSELRKQANIKMSEMRSRGNVGHHGIPVASVAAGKAGMTPERAAEYDARYEKAGRPVGHRPEALVEMTKPAHDRLHNVEEVPYYKALRSAGKSTERVFSQLKNVAGSIRFSPLSPISSGSAFSAQGSIEAKTNVSVDSPAVQMGFKLAN